MFLVAAEDHDVAAVERPGLTGDGELELARLAGEILAGAVGVRYTGQGATRRALHAIDHDARDVVGQKVGEGDGAAHLYRQRAGGVEATGGARRRDQLLDGDLQRQGHLVQNRHGRIGRPRLEVLPG